MAPKETKSLGHANAIKVAAWDPRAERDNQNKKTLRPQGPQNLPLQPGTTASPWRSPALPNLSGSSNHAPAANGVAHLSPTKRPENHKHEALMTEVVAVANHALGELEHGQPISSSMAQAGHLDSPEKSDLWSRLSTRA